jgi:hypothetical protein
MLIRQRIIDDWAKQMKNKLNYTWAILLLLAVSCKSGKEASSIALTAMREEDRVNRIVRSEIRYNDLSSNLKLTVKKGDTGHRTSIDAQLRIVKNEAIRISLLVPILGSEAFRVVFTPDKVVIIDRLNRQYLSESTQILRDRIPFDYYSLEALITNRLFIAGKQEITPADYPDFRIREDKFHAYLSCLDRQKIHYEFESDYTHRIQALRMEGGNGSIRLQCNYAAWGLTSDNRTFPMTMDLQLHTPKEVFDCEFSFRSVTVDTGLTIDDRIPDKYRQISWEQALRLIKEWL